MLFSTRPRPCWIARTGSGQPDSTQAAQIAWGAIHGAVIIDQGGIGQTPDADVNFEHLLDMPVGSLSA